MKTVFLIAGLFLIVSSVVILFTEQNKSTLGLAIGMALVAGYLFRIITEEE